MGYYYRRSYGHGRTRVNIRTPPHARSEGSLTPPGTAAPLTPTARHQRSQQCTPMLGVRHQLTPAGSLMRSR
eukprot:2464885-Rhodomonas_salina.1